ncbi:hydroxyacylglutathione hydrolase [Woodsholea maritima]|uniref:hydroxyacylglutathione hydrolase n=1 Tax=Woodsholea maritima TaxID=240237 RepID=UPI00035D33CF|nr:hydroxyacylglutathione hydrolase [Woodsholea maritima]
MALIIHQFPALEDNYGYFLRCGETGYTVALDVPNDRQVLDELARIGWHLDAIWNTHHHWDHAHDNPGVVGATGAKVFAPEEVVRVVGGVDQVITPGQVLSLGQHRAAIIDVGGHTKGHIAFYFKDEGVAFVGDSLFALGCGRMFEGTPDQMQAGLARLRALPDETLIYCAHEYSAANARYARHVDPDNEALKAYQSEIISKRALNQPTVPFPLGWEKRTNPFLRWDDERLRAQLDLSRDLSDGDVFGHLRKGKDTFKD